MREGKYDVAADTFVKASHLVNANNPLSQIMLTMPTIKLETINTLSLGWERRSKRIRSVQSPT